jgi:hypothetical protein
MPRSNALTNQKKDDPEERLIEAIAACRRDPLKFVRFAFPWGEEGELKEHVGPDAWQIEVLNGIRDGFLTPAQAIQFSVASGHGVGKSAIVSWIIMWALCTCVDARGVVTANTATQLITKTWAELAKWHRLCICSHWFTLTATAIYSKDPEREKTWRIDAVPWSESKVEAFAGLHNQGKRVLVLFDEASAISDVIFETTEGALTDKDTEIVWGCFGNPTRNTGRFRECFGRLRHRWKTWQVDSRTARLTNKEQIAQWVKDYGEDSDFVRVRVRGVFPRAGSMQFIGNDLAEMAMSPERDQEVGIYDPLVMGVDVARFGSDRTVIVLRRGRDARTLPWVKLAGADTMTVAAKVAELSEKYRPDAIFVDGGGPGGGVVDRLRMLHHPVIEVQFGAKSDRQAAGQDGAIVFANKRAEMWGLMREWLSRGMLPEDVELAADLTGVEYGYVLREGRDAILLEKKEDMKKRGLASPDLGDALALTFAYPVAPSDHSAGFAGKPKHESSYDPFARENR